MATDKQYETAVSRIRELEKAIETLKMDYHALKAGAWEVKPESPNAGRTRLYRVEVVDWTQGSCGHGVLSVVLEDVSQAKLVEKALQAVFPSFRVDTHVKKELYDKSPGGDWIPI